MGTASLPVRPQRVAVIGMGAMGKNHARILSELDGAALVAVCDEAPEALSWAARKLHVSSYQSYRELLDAQEELEAVIIAVPTGSHFEVGMAALERNLHVLVEKPIASTLEDSRKLIAAAAARQRVLAVGHVERFNPAIRELKRRLDRDELGRVVQIHARRLGPFPPRIRDVGVVIDLATHDLDVMCFLLGADVIRLYAETQRRIHTDHEDMLSALLKFDNGTVGVLDVNWLTPTKIRDIRVLAERGMIHVDYLSQGLTFFENAFTVGDWIGSPVLAGVSEGQMVRFHVDRAEPLRLELMSFLRAAAAGSLPEVRGEDGVRALRLALDLVASGLKNEIIDASESLSQLATADER